MRLIPVLLLSWLAACGSDADDAPEGTSTSSSGSPQPVDAGAASSSSSGENVQDASMPNDATADAAPPPPKGIRWGVNGHELRPAYPLSQSEAVFQLLQEHHLTLYRVDVLASATDVLDALVVLGATYGVTVRPMLYPTDQATAFALAQRYVDTIPIWEIGNEQDFSHDGAQDRIDAMVATAKGIAQAGLKTSINVMACNSDDPDGRCPDDPNGDMWFVDLAKESGFDFDYLTFHYYPSHGDQGYWFDMYLGQLRAMAEKYGVHAFVNETHCGEIYRGTTDSGHAGDGACYDSMVDFFGEVRAKYIDVVDEVYLYELLDEPNNEAEEAHFGALYDLEHPKPIFSLLTENAAP